MSAPSSVRSVLEGIGQDFTRPGAVRPPRNRECGRCRGAQDDIRRDHPGWEPPQAESFTGPLGRVYWTGLCAQCAQVERNARVTRAIANGETAIVAERRLCVNRDVLDAHFRELRQWRKAQVQIEDAMVATPAVDTAQVDFDRRVAQQRARLSAMGDDLDRSL